MMKNSKGFTLLEVLIAVGLIGILSAIAIPSFMNWLPNYRLKTAARDLYSNMQKVRFEAVKRNTSVAIVFEPANDQYRAFVVQDGTPLFTITMPQSCTLVSTDFVAQTAGYTYQGLPLNGGGRVILRNNQSRWYRVTMFLAGQVQIEVSNDGVNWS